MRGWWRRLAARARRRAPEPEVYVVCAPDAAGRAAARAAARGYPPGRAPVSESPCLPAGMCVALAANGDDGTGPPPFEPSGESFAAESAAFLAAFLAEERIRLEVQRHLSWPPGL